MATLIIFGILMCIGFYMIASDIFQIPHIKTSKAMKSLASRQSTGPSSLDVWLEALAVWISKKIRMNEYKRIQLESDLKTAEMDITPEMHIANSIVKSCLICVLIPFLIFIFPIGIPVVAIIAAVMYRQNLKSVSLQIQSKREAIENELPRLVSTIEKTLMHSRDLLTMLETYKASAGPELKKQLAITTADMRSGNYEAALTRLEARVGSSMLSDVCRGLQGILRGDNTTAYWSSLAVKFSENQRMNMKKRAMKAPGKVKRLSMCLLFCFMLVYIVVILMQIVSSMDIMFG